MRKRLALILLVGLLLSGCGLGFGRRLAGGTAPGSSIGRGTDVPPTETPTEQPTNTPVPTATMTLVPTPAPQAVGLPTEAPGSTALDFVALMCKATWFTKSGDLPCPGDESRSTGGFVMRLPGDVQDLSPNFPVLLTYPPQDVSETIFSKYPDFAVKKGDRFRTVLTCRSHSFCDVEFSLQYYGANGTGSLQTWPYRFTQPAILVDYSLDAIAGLTVQLGLSLRGGGNRLDAYGVWLLPHVYRPAP